MSKILNEFEVVDWIITGISAVLLIVLGFGTVPLYIVYLISRRVDNNVFKIASYITMGLMLISAVGWRFQAQIMEMIYESQISIVDPSTNFRFRYTIMFVALYSLPMIGSIVMWFGFQKQTMKSSFINGSLLFISISRVFMVISFLLHQTIFYNNEYIQFLSFPFYNLISFEPYLFGLILAVLYKDWFLPNAKVMPVEEVYEIYEEAI